jgi:hypothetical protein
MDNIMIQDNNLDNVEDNNEVKYNLNTGVFDTQDIKRTKKKYTIGGKMGYIGSISKLLDILSKKEMKMIIEMFQNHTDGNNLLTSLFADLTSEMDKSTRSRFKKKLIDKLIMSPEYRGRYMLNPYIFKPTSTKHNYQHLTQKLWTFLFVNKDKLNDEVVFHEDDVYGLPDILQLKKER